MRQPLAHAVLLATLIAPLPARAQQYAPPAAPAADPAQPQCTTVTTTTTTCTGAAAPFAVPGAVAPGTVVQPLDVPGPAYPPMYAPPPPPVMQPAPPLPYPYPYPTTTLPPPRRAHVELKPRYGLMIGGLSMFASVYLWNAAFAYTAREGSLAVPIFGPLILMGDLESRNAAKSTCCTDNSGNRLANTLLVFDAIVQATGATMFLVGMLTKHKVTVWEKGDVKMTMVPTAGAGSGGVGVVGVF